MTELAVLVPVLNRPQKVDPLVLSFLSDCPDDASLDFLVSQGDDAEWDAVLPWVETNPQINVFSAPGVETWPQKINFAVESDEVDWYLCAADDIRFVPGWWEATKELRDVETVGVIGTNDSTTGAGNPRVSAGTHTCHPLVRGRYIRDQGTVDEKGKAVHDGYRHWCVDDELIWTAKSRNAWAFCRDAVVEHLHPYWGKAHWDDTYARGEANSDADMALWRERAKLLGLEVA